MNSAVASRESVKNLPSISDSCALFCSRCDGWRLFTPWITRLLMHCHNSARSPSFLLSFAEVHSVFSSLKKMSGERKSFHVCTSRTQIANWRKRKTELLSSLPSLSLSLPALSLSPQSAFKLSAFGGTSTEQLSLPSMGCSSEGGWVLEVLSLFSGFFLPWVPGSLSSSVRFCGWAVERTKEQHGNVRRRSDRSIGLRPSRLSSPSSVPLIGCLRTDGRTDDN